MVTHNSSSSFDPISPRFYGRRVGRTLRKGRREALSALETSFGISCPNDTTLLHSLHPSVWFKKPFQDYALEIGFGGGEHLIAQAQNHPNRGFIGCEPFLSGVADLARHIQQNDKDNIRIFGDDVRLLLPYLQDNVFAAVYILFADPWPKKRHHQRRLIQPAFLDDLARLLQPGGVLRLATDDVSLLEWMVIHCVNHPSFIWQAQSKQDWLVKPADWPDTRYEQKAIAQGRACYYLEFKRVRYPG